MTIHKDAAGRVRPQVVYDGDECLIAREAEITELRQFGAWTDRHTELARKYKVNALHISETSADPWASMEFLLDLPALRSLHVVLCRPKDLTPLTGLKRIEYLGLMGRAVEGGGGDAADFARLKKLKTAAVQMCEPVASILNCGTIERMRIWNDGDQKLRELDLSRLPALQVLGLAACPEIRDLDLTRQPALEELQLEACPKLRSLALHPKARVRRLKLANTGAYRIDWDRTGAALELLELTGPLRWPLEDVLKAPNLRRLSTNGVRKFPPLKFVLELRHLQDFTYFASPPGPKFSQEDREVIRTINARPKSQAAPAFSRWSLMTM